MDLSALRSWPTPPGPVAVYACPPGPDAAAPPGALGQAGTSFALGSSAASHESGGKLLHSITSPLGCWIRHTRVGSVDAGRRVTFTRTKSSSETGVSTH